MEDHGFAISKDNDFDHGISQKNIVRKWKEEYRLASYFNLPQSSGSCSDRELLSNYQDIHL